MSKIWVVDTCALLDVRRCVTTPDDKQKHGERKRVFEALAALA